MITVSKGSKWFMEMTMFHEDSPAPTAQESTASTIQALASNLPALMQAYSKEVGPTAQAQYNSQAQTSPEYAQLMSQLYKQYAPDLAKTGSEIDNSTRLASAKTDADILKGSGADLARTYSGIDRELNPEYYKTRELESSKLGELLGSINLNDSNPEAERLINQENARSGNTGNTSATNTVSNALDFGNAKLARTQTLSNAIGQATNFLQPSSNAQFNPATTILNRPTSNTGTSQFTGITPQSNTAYSAGEGLLNNVAGFQNTAANINANRRDVVDRMNEVTSSL